MGNLKPGTTYVYERADGVIYAREFGNHASQRIIVGYDSPEDYDRHTGRQEDKLWGKMRLAAKTNPALQEALDRAKIIYELGKKDE